MTDATATRGPALTPRRYRWVDRLTKLTGLALISVGFHTGITTLAGLVLVLLGLISGLVTVLIDKQ
ncbi:hypothetical protein ACFQH2_17785 [Natronoarchaeum sp. GCM10025703]|uniref:hypothetical protein n=1 Tax=unclassified Natronoarchaeum TaxID=2620183 RepID=UPI003615A96A